MGRHKRSTSREALIRKLLEPLCDPTLREHRHDSNELAYDRMDWASVEGWRMLPELQLAQLESGTLRPLASSAHLDVALYWQQCLPPLFYLRYF